MPKYDSLTNTFNNFVNKKIKNSFSSGMSKRISKTGRGLYNVMDYGAIGDSSYDNTVILQNVINVIDGKGGGVLYFPSGTYIISSALALCDNITIAGDGGHVSIIKQVTTNENGLYALDKHNMCFYNIGLYGTNGQYSKDGTGTGIVLNRDSNNNITYCSFDDVWVYRFGQDGIDIMTILVSDFNKVHCEENGRYGFYFHNHPTNSPNAPCTSCTFNSCYANSNYEYGFYLVKCVYFSLNACACDGTTLLGQTKYGYVIDFGQGISLQGCAAESVSLIDFWFTNTCYGCGLFQPWIYDLQNIGIQIDSGSKQIQVIGGAQTDPNASAVYSVVVESNCRVTVIGFRVGDVTENISNESTTWIDSGTLGAALFPNNINCSALYSDIIGANQNAFIRVDSQINFYDDVEFYNNLGAGYYRLFGIANTSVPNKSIFLDSSDNVLKWKDSLGVLHDLI